MTKITETMIIEQLSYIKESCEKIKGTSSKYLLNTTPNSDLVYVSICLEVNKLILSWNWLVPHINKILEEMSFDLKVANLDSLNANVKDIREKKKVTLIDPELISLALNCQRVLSILKNTSTSTKEIKNKFDSLKKEIEVIGKEIDSDILKNLIEALNEFENNHLLATVLICGRIIIYLLDSVSNKIEEVIKEMKLVGMLAAKGSEELILKANKKVRGLFAHDLTYSPEASETLSIFGDTINIVKKISEYKKLKNKTDTLSK